MISLKSVSNRFCHFGDRSKSLVKTSRFQQDFESFWNFETFWSQGPFYRSLKFRFYSAPKRFLGSGLPPKYRSVPLLTLPLILSLSLLCYSYTFSIPAEKVFPARLALLFLGLGPGFFPDAALHFGFSAIESALGLSRALFGSLAGSLLVDLDPAWVFFPSQGCSLGSPMFSLYLGGFSSPRSLAG